nr:hypothetical protein [Streptomyces tirandamycinicus]
MGDTHQRIWKTTDIPLTVERAPDPDMARERTAHWREHQLSLPIDWGCAPLFR